MSESYVIKPDNRSLRVIEGIESISLSFALEPLLEEAEIREILVNTKDAIWEITLVVKNSLSKGQTEELEQALTSLIIGLTRVKLKVISIAELPPMTERLERNWEKFLSASGAKYPTLNGWLTEARYALYGERQVEIQVRNKAGVDILTNKAEELKELLRELVYEDLTLSFVVGDFTAKIMEDEEFYREQEIEALVQALTQAETAPKKASPGNGGGGDSDQVYGKRFTGEPTPIKSLTEPQDQVIVAGEIFRFESRTSKNNNKFYLGDITDLTDSLSFKIFPRGNHTIEENIKEGTWVRIRGELQDDPYLRELALLVTDMTVIPARRRTDKAEEKRAELHFHTKMSAMDATADVVAALKTAAAWGHPALAITDHGVAHAYPEAFAAAKKLGIKVIYGLEGYLVDDGVPIVVGATNEPLQEGTYVVFDIETTGFNPRLEDLLEIGAVKYVNGVKKDEFGTMVRPGKEISAEIQNLTGITPEMVKDAPLPVEAIRAFLEFAGDAVLVAHNAQFDIGFMTIKLENLLGMKWQPISLDTLGLSRALWPGLKSHRLNVVAKELGIDLHNHHRAVDDARCTGRILEKAFAKVAERNFMLLADLNSLVKETGVEHLRTQHISLLVHTQIGMKNLYRLISDSHLRYFHRHPRIPRSELVKWREGLLIGSACEAGELYHAILDGATEERILQIAGFYDFFEIMPRANNRFLIDNGRVKSEEDLMEINRKIIELGHKLGKLVVATGDAHFIEPHEEICRRILLVGQDFKDADKPNPLYFRTTEEMLEEFSYLGPELAREVVVENTRRVADMIENVRPFPDGFFPPDIPGAAEEIRETSYARARELYGDPLPQLVEERLEWELKSIIGHGYAVLYLTAQKLVLKSLSDGYLVGSRGSVGSSFVATMCRITEVNPLPPHYRCEECKYSEFIPSGSLGSGYDLSSKDCPRCGRPLIKDGHDIPFATFMGFEGDKEPDIDLNFSGEYQAEVQHYTEELFGKESVFRAGTVTGLAEKMAFGFVKGYTEEKGLKFRQAEMNRLAKGCSGVRRSTGQHPGGMYVVPKDQEIYSFTPIQYPANDYKAGWITTHFDYHGALEGRLVKLDILGHDDPTVIRMLHDLTGIDPRTVPFDDPQTMQIFSSVAPLGLTEEQLGFDLGCLGIPEFGTGFVRQMLEATLPQTFSELIYISGLSHGTNVWLGNAQDLIKNKTATLSEVISTRDDIMTFLIFKGLPPKTAFKIMEKVRKGKGLEEEEIKIMKEHDIPQWYIDSCLKIKYMFPKAHAVAYVMMAFRIAYFKVHHPAAYYATYFSVRADEFDADIVVKGEESVRGTMQMIRQKGNEATQKEKNLDTILELVMEAMLRGIKFLRVDIYKSDPQRFIITPEGLLPPLASLQGLGDNAANYIAQARSEGEFMSIEDLKTRSRLTSAVIEVLNKHGCLQGMTESNQLTLF